MDRGPVDLPDPGEESVDEDGSHQPVSVDGVAILAVDDSGAVGVAEDRVVEWWEEPGRRRSCGIWQRAVEDVEELVAVRVGKSAGCSPT
jgi:hypothetical protein